MASRTARRQRTARRVIAPKRKPVDVPTGDSARLAELLGVPAHVDTDTAAKLLGVQPQSLRRWACQGEGPLAPIKIGDRLRWRLADIRAVLNGDAPPQPSSHATQPEAAPA